MLAMAMAGYSSVKDQSSPIVQRAKACGFGETALVSPVAMQDWFHKHRDCAVSVDQMCKPVRQNAPAAWTNSTEGRLCLAARDVAQWVRKPNQDHSTFQAGWK